MNRQPLPDPELWSRVLSGDDRAFGSIFDRHRDRVFRHVRWLGADTTDAEDLTATVFLELWRRRATTPIVDNSLLPWLLATASNVSRNATRARHRYRRFLASLPPGDIAPDASLLAEQRIEAELRSAAIARAAQSLSLQDQQLIMLITLEDLSLEQVSQALGISYGAAKTRLSRARKRLDAFYSANSIDSARYGVTS